MLLILTRMGRRIARHQPALRVIEGGRTQLIDEVARVAENLRELERALVAAREELRRLVLVAKPDRPSGRQGKGGSRFPRSVAPPARFKNGTRGSVFVARLIRWTTSRSRKLPRW